MPGLLPGTGMQTLRRTFSDKPSSIRNSMLVPPLRTRAATQNTSRQHSAASLLNQDDAIIGGTRSSNGIMISNAGTGISSIGTGASSAGGGGTGGGGGGGVSVKGSDEELEPIVSLEVTKVERAGKRFATYMTYVIVGTITFYNTSSADSGGDRGRRQQERLIETQRRYTDFQALRKHICKQYPALHEVLPALPEKKVLGKFKASFLENRREGLQRFLAAVVTQQPSYRFLPRYLHRFMSADPPS